MIDTEGFMLLSLVFMRITGCILFNPILGRRNIPAIVKSGFIMVLTIIVYTYSQDILVIDVKTPIEYGLLLFKEFAVGYVLGTVVNMFLYLIIFAGEIIDLQLGISMAKVFDAQSNSSLAVSASFFNAFFLMLFFVADGHLALIKIMITSNEIIAYGNVTLNPEISMAVLSVFTECTLLAMKFSFPIFAVEFLAEMGVGILMKTIPQINVFVVNIQAKLVIGLFLLLFFFSPMANFLENMIFMMFDAIKTVINMMG